MISRKEVGNNMPEVYGISKSAKHIFERGYGQSAFNRTTAEDFFIDLRNAIESEYNSQGYCELIDNLLMGTTSMLDSIAYCAIANAGKRLSYKKGDSTFVPLNVTQPIYWNQVAPGQFQYDLHSAWAWKEIIECRKRGQRNHVNYIKKMASENEDVSIINQANDMIMKAKRESENIINTANSKASEIIASAEKKVGQLTQSGENRTSTEGASCYLRKDAIRNQCEENVRESATEHLYLQQRKIKLECEKEIATLIEQNQKALAKSEAIHDQMCSVTNELQVAWMKSLTSATDQLLTLKEEFYKHLRTWQQGLYPSEYEQLAERYIELYRIIDLDKVISEAMIDIDNNTTVLNRLQTLDKSLHIFLHKFELSMNGLGLYVYRAEVGDDFDYVWHLNEDDSIDCSGKKIRKCITPGVAKRVQGDEEDDVIIQALVSV